MLTVSLTNKIFCPFTQRQTIATMSLAVGSNTLNVCISNLLLSSANSHSHSPYDNSPGASPFVVSDCAKLASREISVHLP
jgi:hypothetical protein